MVWAVKLDLQGRSMALYKFESVNLKLKGKVKRNNKSLIYYIGPPLCFTFDSLYLLHWYFINVIVKPTTLKFRI